MQDRSGERLLEAALAALAAALDATRVAWMIIGGLAVIARGVRRMTTDIDAVVEGGSIDIACLLETLVERQIVPRIEDAVKFAQENLVLLAVHQPTGIELDISLGWTAFEREALALRQVVRFGSVSVPMAQAEDLVIFKALAARPKDIEDASAILLLHGDIDLTRVRQMVHQLAVLAEEPDLERGIEEVIQASRARSHAAQLHLVERDAHRAVRAKTKRAKKKPRN